MKIKIDIAGVPELVEVAGHKKIEFDLQGTTIKDLIEEIIKKYGIKAKQALFDNNDSLDPTIQILINGTKWVYHDNYEVNLSEGDVVSFMMLLAGG